MSPTTRQPAPVTLEQAGLYPGTGFRLSPEEEAELERAQATEVARKCAELDDLVDACSRCLVCGGNRSGRPDGLCGDCALVVNVMRAERVGAERINGQTRKQLVAQYLKAGS
jgi:hypothetical protein